MTRDAARTALKPMLLLVLMVMVHCAPSRWTMQLAAQDWSTRQAHFDSLTSLEWSDHGGWPRLGIGYGEVTDQRNLSCFVIDQSPARSEKKSLKPWRIGFGRLS